MRGGEESSLRPLDAAPGQWKVTASPEPLAVIGLPPSAWPAVTESGFADARTGASLIGTPGELTLVAPWGRVPVARGLFPGLEVEGPFRLLTVEPFPATGGAGDVGFLARVTRVLADAGVRVKVLSGFSRDHLLVRDEDADDAVGVLEGVTTEGGGPD